MILALNLAKQTDDLVATMLQVKPIDDRNLEELDALQQALETQTLSWSKLGEITYEAALEQGYRFDIELP